MAILGRLLDRTRWPQVLLATALCVTIGVVWIKLSDPLAGLAIAVLPIAAVIVLRFPFHFVLGFVLFSFFRLHEVFSPLYPLHIPQFLAIGALASLGWSLWSGQVKPYWSRELSTFAAFFLLISLGVFLATNRGEAMSSFTGTYVKIGIMVVAIAWLTTEPDRMRLVSRAFMAAGILVGLVALHNKINGVGLVEGTRVTIGRDIGSMLGDPNDLALVLLFPAGFALSYLLNPGIGRGTRILALIAFVTVVAAVIVTQSRGGLLGIVAVTGVFAYRRVTSKLFLGGVAAAAMLLLFAVAGVGGRASGGAREGGIDESAMGRLHAWNAAIEMALDHPVTGVGLNNFISNYWSYSDFWDGQNHAVHSTWFGVLAEAGFLGLAVFATMIVVVFRSVLASVGRFSPDAGLPEGPIRHEGYALSEALLASMAGFAVSGTFLTMGFTWPVYILLALATALGRLSSNLQHQLSHPVSQSENK